MADRNSDKVWADDQERHGWVMPRAPWWKRLPVIRHVRAAYLGIKADRHARMYASFGIGLGHVSQLDSWVIYGIWNGRERPMQED